MSRPKPEAQHAQYRQIHDLQIPIYSEKQLNAVEPALGQIFAVSKKGKIRGPYLITKVFEGESKSYYAVSVTFHDHWTHARPDPRSTQNDED